MSKQDIIREGIKSCVSAVRNDRGPQIECLFEAAVKNIISYLHSQGVAIVVEGELPEIGWLGGEEVTNEEKAERVIGDMLKAGYKLTIPLVG